MAEWGISVQIDEEFAGKVEAGWAGHVVEEALRAEGVAEGTEVSLVITDDMTVQELNRTYRNLDEPTDVLSFALTEEAEAESEDEEPFRFVLPPGLTDLGEVIISFETTERQAQDGGVPLVRELALLIVHGVLHLLGYDHAEKAEEEVMRSREQAILQAVFS